MKAFSITIVIACLNEEKNLCATHQGVTEAINHIGFVDHEILIVNDASTDRTGEIADRLATESSQTLVLHNRVNRGLGYSLKAGLTRSRMTHLAVVPGDNEIMSESILDLLSAVGKADLVAGYTISRQSRIWLRRFLSGGFVTLINLLFGYRMHYYNGPNVFRTQDLRKIDIDINSFAYSAAAVVKVLRQGHDVVQVGLHTRPQKQWRTRALRPHNLMAVVVDVLKLFRDIYL